MTVLTWRKTKNAQGRYLRGCVNGTSAYAIHAQGQGYHVYAFRRIFFTDGSGIVKISFSVAGAKYAALAELCKLQQNSWPSRFI